MFKKIVVFTLLASMIFTSGCASNNRGVTPESNAVGLGVATGMAVGLGYMLGKN